MFLIAARFDQWHKRCAIVRSRWTGQGRGYDDEGHGPLQYFKRSADAGGKHAFPPVAAV